MAPTPPSTTENHHPIHHLSTLISTTITSLLPKPTNNPTHNALFRPVSSFFDPAHDDPLPSSSSSVKKKKSMDSGSGSGFPSTLRISGLNSNGKGGGPAFVGQVFSMCDLSGTGLMAVSTHFDIPFISKRTPGWLKKMFAAVTKSERNGPVFRFFMDLGDAVSYVKQLNIPSGVVGACRLDLAYEHFKEKPHLFQFIPNEKQVKEANKLLKTMPQNGQKSKVEGVPVFSAENLDIAIATTDGIKWYTPYFFDKNMLDKILEESVDQHFHSLIKTRHSNRRRDIVDDSMASEVFEENAESIWEPPEIQEVMDEIGPVDIPLSVISKAAEIQLLYNVDKVLLGNRWMRKATGIQPKFPYLVDSFERRTEASFLRASESSTSIADAESELNDLEYLSTSKAGQEDNLQVSRRQQRDFRFPFGDWLTNPWLEPLTKEHHNPDERTQRSSPEREKKESQSNVLLPKITMVGISTGEAGQMNKAAMKKTMDDLTRELEESDQGSVSSSNDYKYDDRDPLFVANVGDYYSGMSKAGSAKWVRGMR
ncbi:uncharacterized protein LOC108210488 [Daucus carota subsp. sativus]|uniref:uncharacterized protein LOC108210488 n=1 Tax=Daucus carota subsp. sativus TaxID=79200 RepID=UPI0007F0422C|nr:PREDICTED: uncharacterized protein LOC108210488 [Daucus carota subsp. sativus]